MLEGIAKFAEYPLMFPYYSLSFHFNYVLTIIFGFFDTENDDFKTNFKVFLQKPFIGTK